MRAAAAVLAPFVILSVPVPVLADEPVKPQPVPANVQSEPQPSVLDHFVSVAKT